MAEWWVAGWWSLSVSVFSQGKGGWHGWWHLSLTPPILDEGISICVMRNHRGSVFDWRIAASTASVDPLGNVANTPRSSTEMTAAAHKRTTTVRRFGATRTHTQT